ncbi:hypothetical protein R54767_01969 [Paraburkholderia gardini]|uniref:MAE-28990/MAE-18760-like HEPN domain-containing protein n=2 Tax=Paraburkholderia gardini TaxID=2823469 RepID=A0ABM8U276_9BURK|nr:hypothetical protein R54767_01969 [Paraburkholderia gardini]
MGFKSLESILLPDRRYADLRVVDNGTQRHMSLEFHHATLAAIGLQTTVPVDVSDAFDRARNTLIYAFFDYALWVVGEAQACGAFELALKHRLNGHGGPAWGNLRTRVERARKDGILPPRTPDVPVSQDPIEALIQIRNGLSHGTADIHSPAMGLQVLETCAYWINFVYRAPQGAD